MNPQAQQFMPRSYVPPTQFPTFQVQPLPPSTLPPPSPTRTRTLLLCTVPTHVTARTVRIDLQVFGDVKSVEMERLQEGIVIVHFYDLRHSAAALAAIQDQHIQQQYRVGQHYSALGSVNGPPPMPLLVDGLVAGYAVWAQFYVPGISAGINQGIIMVRNFDPVFSSAEVLAFFEFFGTVKELRRSRLERDRWFVEFFDIRAAAAALSRLDGERVLRKNLEIRFITFPEGQGGG